MPCGLPDPAPRAGAGASCSARRPPSAPALLGRHRVPGRCALGLPADRPSRLAACAAGRGREPLGAVCVCARGEPACGPSHGCAPAAAGTGWGIQCSIIRLCLHCQEWLSAQGEQCVSALLPDSSGDFCFIYLYSSGCGCVCARSPPALPGRTREGRAALGKKSVCETRREGVRVSAWLGALRGPSALGGSLGRESHCSAGSGGCRWAGGGMQQGSESTEESSVRAVRCCG